MPRKRRRIVVHNVSYQYVVSSIRAGEVPSFVEVRVWREDGQRGQMCVIRVRFDDPWHHCGVLLSAPIAALSNNPPVIDTRPVTPGMVREMIEACLALGWVPEQKGPALHIDWDKDAHGPLSSEPLSED